MLASCLGTARFIRPGQRMSAPLAESGNRNARLRGRVVSGETDELSRKKRTESQTGCLGFLFFLIFTLPRFCLSRSLSNEVDNASQWGAPFDIA